MIPDTSWAPHAWRDLLSELNGRAPDGTPGVRDVDASCDVYAPVEIPEGEDANGDCETDGHYLCADGRSVCRHISERALRRRRERCEECGTKLLAPGTHRERCPSCEPEPTAALAPAAVDTKMGCVERAVVPVRAGT